MPKKCDPKKLLSLYNESTTEKIVKSGLRVWKMPDGGELQESIKIGDSRKVAIAIVTKHRTSVSNIWIAECLGMEHNQPVKRLCHQGKAE